MEKPLLNTEKYLRRVESADLEIPDERLLASLERINVPVKQITYGNEGRVDFLVGDVAVEFTYERLDDNEQDEFQDDYSMRVSGKTTKDGVSLLDPSQWRVIRSFRLSTPNSHLLSDIVPAPHKVFFCPTAVESDLNGAVCLNNKNIFIIGDMVTPRAVATLLHEIGHTWDQKNLEDHKVTDFMDQHTQASKAEEVRSERSATAWAIKKLRPFVHGELKSDIINFLKYYALRSYYDSLKSGLAHDRAISRFWGPDPFNDEWWEENIRRDDFEEFKSTDEYVKWKRDEGIDGLDEEEEYAKWCEWIERDRDKETVGE